MLPCRQKMSTHFEINRLFGKVARIAGLECVLKARGVATKLSLLRINASRANERCCALHRYMMNEFLDSSMNQDKKLKVEVKR